MSCGKPHGTAKIAPTEVHSSLAKHMLVDGFPFVLDMDRSHGTYMVDKATGTEYLDFFTYFASNALGHNHPGLKEKEFHKRLGEIAILKPSNSDLYTIEMAEFVDTFARIAVPPGLPNLFFIDGGALGVENALKAAFDWKVRKNFARGYKEEKGTQVVHFREAFHGRTGYTLSLTNTDPAKTNYFPKFKWPRIENPKVVFPLEKNLDAVVAAEKRAVAAIEKAFADNKDDIAAIIIEPIQGEGGDNHFRGEFLRELRRIADEREAILVFDEVQTGVGATGKMWCWQHFGVQPDILAFGKKAQICGIMASDRLNEVDSVFKVSSRINSTWGGNLVDMYRAKRILEIIDEEKLVDNAAKMGTVLQKHLGDLEKRWPDLVSNARGLGIFCAFDLPDSACRDALLTTIIKHGLLVLKCGTKTIRFRPPLIVSKEEIDKAAGIIEAALKEYKGHVCKGDTSGAVHTE
ncbi:MAG: L-lysine 6-transaminase [Candidatus Latescibacterota bacterium]|jgi:L-lysine 6-transaminase|nr:MAG: L-lysine 6-transaminase [Candidatus Latescibacterota bacterium]